MNQWQPIDTAPKDGTIILVYYIGPWDQKHVLEASWCSKDGDYNNPCWWPEWHGTMIDDHITHWMPLPDPPA